MSLKGADVHKIYITQTGAGEEKTKPREYTLIHSHKESTTTQQTLVFSLYLYMALLLYLAHSPHILHTVLM